MIAVHPAHDQPRQRRRAAARRRAGSGDSSSRSARPAAPRRSGPRRCVRAPRRLTVTPRIRRPSHSIPATSQPTAQRDAERAQVRHPGVDPDLARRRVEHAVGAASRAREVEQQLQRITPPVRAEISRPRAATSVRVSPSARNFWNAAVRRSAPMYCHQLERSHCSSRRSSHEVSIVSSRSTNSASSGGGMPAPVPNSHANRTSTARSSSDDGRAPG